jgi:tRNA (guanine10-N2)-methyltransferase
LITIKKTTTEDYPPPVFAQKEAKFSESDGGEVNAKHVPAHKDFREKYFQGFNKEKQQARYDAASQRPDFESRSTAA